MEKPGPGRASDKKKLWKLMESKAGFVLFLEKQALLNEVVVLKFAQ